MNKKTIINIQGNMGPPELSSTIIGSPGYPNAAEVQEEKLQTKESPTGEMAKRISEKVQQKTLKCQSQKMLNLNKTFLTQNIEEFWDGIRRPNVIIIETEERDNSQLKGQENIFNKLNKIPYLKKMMINI